MTIRTSLSALAAASILLLSLAGCAAGGDTTTTDPGTSTGTDETTDDTGDFDGVTLAGTGEHTIPDQAPIGGYELPDNQDGLPDGCTWQLYLTNGDLFVENEGSFVFFTDVTGKFVTNGCPDWVQFE